LSSFEEVRRECKEALMKVEGSDELHQRVLAGINEHVQLSYESQAIITNAHEYMGDFDGYLRSLRKSTFRYVKSSARKFLDMHSGSSDGGDLELILKMPKSVRAVPQNDLYLPGGYTISIKNFDVAFEGKDSCLLEEAWKDIAAMSWQMCLRQSSSPAMAYTQFVRHVVPFDSTLFPDAVTAGVRSKITNEWIGFFAYQYIHSCDDNADGDRVKLAQCLAALGKKGPLQQANEWHVIYQQFMINHILRSVSIDSGTKFYVNTCTGLGSQSLVDQKVRMFIPQSLQQRRVLRFEGADQPQLSAFLETLKSGGVALNKALPAHTTFAVDGMKSNVEIGGGMALAEVHFEEAQQDGRKIYVTASAAEVLDALYSSNDCFQAFMALRNRRANDSINGRSSCSALSNCYVTFHKLDDATVNQSVHEAGQPSIAIMREVWKYHETRRTIFSQVANDLFGTR